MQEKKGKVDTMQKISKRQARKLFMNFKPFIMCASKCSPLSMFAVKIDEHTNRDYNTNDGFEALVNEFKAYNCGLPETGRGVCFYVDN